MQSKVMSSKLTT